MINPAEITTVSVHELVPAVWSLDDLLPHEVDETLRQGSVQGLADLISAYIGTVSSLAFNPTTVNSGETLPATTTTEWMFVGKGTFLNVGGGSDITTTEELNVLTSNGTYWSLAVQIPIDVEFSGVVQTIRSGFTATVPSENAVFQALALKANTSDIPVAFPKKLERFGNGTDNTIDIGTTSLATLIFLEGAPLIGADWEQLGTKITFTFIPESGTRLQII
jgi:hypothetical protein